MNVLHRPLITPDEFEQMSGMDGFELVDGEPKEKGMGLESSWVQSQIGHLLRQWVSGGSHGWVFESEAGYICFPHRPKLVRKPDASFVRHGRFPDNQLPRGYGRLVPDLAVEVVSPNDEYREVEDKVNDYLLVAVPMVWVVNPPCRSVYVYLATGVIRRLTANDELIGDPILPGFHVRVADLFPPPAPESAEPAADETQP
ncbi:MAG TPA: Uma2 family endonuclease [Fimbriiglobus sp.]|nr:Uma2 family endonuclease [Fimbriiglobus sp.]